MASVLPLIPSEFNYRVQTTIDGTSYLFDLRWNGRDESWYIDVLEVDETPIVQGEKVALGALIGRISTHKLFRRGVLVAVDLSSAGREATYDDLGTRVVVMWMPLSEVLARRVTATFPQSAT